MSHNLTNKQLEDLYWRQIANRPWRPGRSAKLRAAVRAILLHAEWRRTAAINYARHMS